jgi:hypothetical protein
VFSKLLKQYVPLKQCFVVTDEIIEVYLIELRDHRIEILSSNFAAFIDKVAVIRRNHYKRKQSDMIRQAVVFLIIQLKLLFVTPFLDARDLVAIVAVFVESSVNSKELFIMMYVLRIGGIEIAFTKRKVMYSVEDIGFTGAVIPYKAIYLD